MMKYKPTFTFAFSAIACAAFSSYALADITIADNGKSTFTIVIPAQAPTSVQNAAEELQRDIELATNAKLLIQKDDTKLSGSFISLGNTAKAKNADISSDKMTDESYRIVTKSGNVYIIGPDTPDDGWTNENGVSDGTANGVYSFLEDYLNVRWLMPGDIGRDVPAKSTFTLADVDRHFTPKFSMRQLTHLSYYTNASQYKNVTAWYDHHKVGERAGATNWYYMHNWWRQLNISSGKRSSEPDTPAVKKFYAEHPGWFAMDKNGQRPFPRNHYAKLETTDQSLVNWFADQAVETFNTEKRPVAFSLSPSDGSGWSLSPESKALYDPNPDPSYDPEAAAATPSMSSLVLKWYHDIAKIVAQKAPDRVLTGFLYSSYIYPPQKFSATLPSNFSPVIAPSHNYGYGLYRPDVQKYFHTVMGDWSKIVTGKWFYYDLPNQLLRQNKASVGDANFPGGVGLVTPPASDIINTIFQELLKSHINGGDIYGDNAWSNAALSNYILAKMLWDPTLNAFDVRNEWLDRAYGPAAGKAMEKFYDQLNDWFRAYYQANEKVRYELPPQMLQDLYAAHYPEMEQLFLQAKSQKMTPMQQKRLQLIENNLIVLQWRLRNAHYLPQNFSSPLQRNDAQINDIIAQVNPDFSSFAGVTNPASNQRKVQALPWKVLLSKDVSATDESTLPAWNDGQFLLYAAQDGDIHITTQMVTNGIYFAAYEIKNEKGELITSGIFNKEKPIVFAAKAGQSYTLNIPLRKPVNFQLQVQNAAMAQGELQGKTLALSSEKSAPVYVFYVPGKASIGAFAKEDNVNIRKPYSGAVINNYIQSLTARGKYSEARLLETFDDNWLFNPDPKDDGMARGVLNADFNDSSWTPISPLNWWQFQGFSDYHGAAWYRLKFQGKPLQKGEEARIYFGAIDGNATVYLNGKKVAEHLLGADYAGWDKAFTANITRYMKPDENILAVHVVSKNDTTASGIFKPVALYAGVRR